MRIPHQAQEEIQLYYLEQPTPERSATVMACLRAFKRDSIPTTTTTTILGAARAQGDTNLFIDLTRSDSILCPKERRSQEAIALYCRWDPLPSEAVWGDILHTLPDLCRKVFPTDDHGLLWSEALPTLAKSMERGYARSTTRFLLQHCPAKYREPLFEKLLLAQDSIPLRELLPDGNYDRVLAYCPAGLLQQVVARISGEDLAKCWRTSLESMANLGHMAQLDVFAGMGKMTPEIATETMTAAIQFAQLKTALHLERKFGADRAKAVALFDPAKVPLWSPRRDEVPDVLAYFTSTPPPTSEVNVAQDEPLETHLDLV